MPSKTAPRSTGRCLVAIFISSFACISCRGAAEPPGNNPAQPPMLFETIGRFVYLPPGRGIPRRPEEDPFGDALRPVIHACPSLAYSARYEWRVGDDCSTITVRVSDHSSPAFHPVDAWLAHDINEYLWSFVERNETFEVAVRGEQLDGQQVLVANVRGKWVPQRGDMIAWLDSRGTLVTVNLSGNARPPLYNEVVKAYLKRHPSALRAQDIILGKAELEKSRARKYAALLSTLLDDSAPELVKAHAAEIHEQFAKTTFCHLDRSCVGTTPGKDDLREVLEWWDTHKDETISQWYDGFIDRLVRRIEEEPTESPKYQSVLLTLEVACTLKLPPVSPDSLADVEKSKSNWSRWWKSCRSEPWSSRWRRALEIHIDELKHADVTTENIARWRKELVSLRELARVRESPDALIASTVQDIERLISWWLNWWSAHKEIWIRSDVPWGISE